LHQFGYQTLGQIDMNRFSAGWHASSWKSDEPENQLENTCLDQYTEKISNLRASRGNQQATRSEDHVTLRNHCQPGLGTLIVRLMMMAEH
jgi:hypothetical protein